ncbi:MAG: response regulator transcription factor [Firmicutes bacterium]|nr:response regulator transcription factor [Bacillota bacterium]
MIKILLADDYVPFRQVLEDFLETANPRLKVMGRATNGKDALYIAECSPIDVAVIDIRMPIMDGLELTRRLKHMLGNSLSIITYTGLRSVLLKEQVLRAGADLHLIKPLELFGLKNAVTHLAESKRKIKPDDQASSVG